jgi:hypothetical protein
VGPVSRARSAVRVGRRRSAGAIAGVAAAILLAAYLFDPPWAGSVTSGLRPWQTENGVRYRWTNGHASFFVPSEALTMTLPLRAVFPAPDGKPVQVALDVDDRRLVTVELEDPSEWTRVTIPLPRRTTGRSFRRVEVRVSRTVGDGNLGVQVGEPGLEGP